MLWTRKGHCAGSTRQAPSVYMDDYLLARAWTTKEDCKEGKDVAHPYSIQVGVILFERRFEPIVVMLFEPRP
jgi:hypothetical protein